MPRSSLQKNSVNYLKLINIFKKGENVESMDKSRACQVFLQVVKAMPLNEQIGLSSQKKKIPIHSVKNADSRPFLTLSGKNFYYPLYQ